MGQSKERSSETDGGIYIKPPVKVVFSLHCADLSQETQIQIFDLTVKNLSVSADFGYQDVFPPRYRYGSKRFITVELWFLRSTANTDTSVQSEHGAVSSVHGKNAVKVATSVLVSTVTSPPARLHRQPMEEMTHCPTRFYSDPNRTGQLIGAAQHSPKHTEINKSAHGAMLLMLSS